MDQAKKNSVDAILKELYQTKDQGERTQLHTRILQLIVQTTKITSAYLCQLNRETSQSVCIADYIGDKANILERQSDVGVYYDEIPTSILGGWVINETSLDKAIDFNQLPSDDPDRVDYLRYGARTVYLKRIVVQNQTWGYLAMWESRYSHRFKDDDIALFSYIASEIAKAYTAK